MVAGLYSFRTYDDQSYMVRYYWYCIRTIKDAAPKDQPVDPKNEKYINLFKF
jgi:hypothetical protein